MSSSDAWSFLEEAQVIRIGINAPKRPYIVPINFVLFEGDIYFHSALEGRKTDLLKNNTLVFAEVDQLIEIKESDVGCKFSCYYKSVMVEGTVEKILDGQTKANILNILVGKYTLRDFVKVTKKESENVLVYKLKVENIIGKELLPD